ncbi:MAG: BREX-1 system adenine-specific DNA-methyltransferase PglX, partial [Bacteroides sp.]
ELSDEVFINNAIENLKRSSGMFAEKAIEKLRKMKEQIQQLSQKFSAVVANPPYMPTSSLEPWAKEWVQKKYADAKSDFFAAFVLRNLHFADKAGELGFMTPFVWMFISSYEGLRKKLIDSHTITSLIQLEYSGFDGATVPICTFSIQNAVNAGYKGGYVRLSDFVGAKKQAPKALEAIRNPDCGWFYRADAQDFKVIPGSPIAYWASEAMREAFKTGKPLGDVVDAKQGLATANNNRFLRFWWELDYSRIKFDATSVDDAARSGYKWFPYNKGGEFRKWYGNNDYVVNWENDGYEIKHFVDDKGKQRSRPQNTAYYFRSSITWTDIASSGTHFRFRPSGSLYDVKGMSCFPEPDECQQIIGFCNSSLSFAMLKVLSPTLSTQIGEVSRLPVFCVGNSKDGIDRLVDTNIEYAQADWDSFDTSWDFEQHPLAPSQLGSASLISDCYTRWSDECQQRFDTLKANEEELNRIFAEIYHMENEVPIEVPDDKVSVRRADLQRDIKSLISYGVGCLFGRYSVDKPGLILADQGSAAEDFREKLPNASFSIDEDGILPVLDGEWFADDITAQFKKWLEVVYGADTLSENIAFIEEALGKDIRTYF